jgi:disulfide bond formation protein DsbB
MLILILIFIGLPALIVLIDFLGFLFTGHQVVNNTLLRITEVGSLIILPLMYGGFGAKNDCCDDDSAVFSPDHQITIGIIILLCLTAYFYSSYRTKISTPIIEIVTNALLFIGIVLNIFIAIHTKDMWLAIGGNMPIVLLAILVLVKNQQVFIEYSQETEFKPKNSFENIAWKILNLQPILKFPIILILCLPILAILTAILLLVGQKPDSLVRAFTDTYKHGFSQWDYKCDNVQCGGHYLCSVAANGHTKIVKPQRRGIRNGHNIICNRQLLISNAFEDLIQDRLPFLHKPIRRHYNKVGNLIHKYYDIFNNKFVSDFIYILMKPFEWFFLLTLYTFDRKPENRIAKQYISSTDRQQIDRH